MPPPSTGLPSRASLIRNRWIAVVVEACVAVAAFLLFVFWRRSDVADLLDRPPWAWIAGGSCLVPIAWLLGRDRWSAFFGFRHLASYPPPWLAAVLASGIVFLLIWQFPGLRAAIGLDVDVPRETFLVGRALVLGFLGVAALSAAGLLVRGRKKKPLLPITSSLGPVAVPAFSSFLAIEKWLMDDGAVTDSSRDAFGFARMADRIASRLAQDEAPAQAVVGPLGSGKTTLRYLVEEALGRPDGDTRTHLVAVELWPFENPKAALTGVISALIEALSREVSVLSLRGLPASYAEAMSAAGGFWSALIRVQTAPSNPLDSLKAIDRLAKTICIRYVVWIEDLERFAGQGPVETVEERLNPIRALLYGLDQLESVTVVTATTSLNVRFDIEKIARHVEPLPPIPEGEVRKIIAQLRTGCTGETGYVDPATRSARRTLDEFNKDYDVALVRSWVGPGIHDLGDALVFLCGTPRALKRALRACLDTWNRLKGEIDFDDVLVLSILREAQPDAFSLVQDHLHLLRSNPARDERRDPEKEWKHALAGLTVNDKTRSSIELIVAFVFDSRTSRGRPQGVSNRNHVDYWERFVTVPRLTDKERDQPLLQAMVAPDDEPIILLLEDPDRSACVEDFQHLLETERILRMFLPIVIRRSGESTGAWVEQEPPGLIPVWRMLVARGKADKLKPPTMWHELQHAYDVAVPRNLSLASELERIFVTASGGVHNLLGEGQESFRAMHRPLLASASRALPAMPTG